MVNRISWTSACQPVHLEGHPEQSVGLPEEGTLEQRKEFLRGFLAEIGIDPDSARGTIDFYDLPVTSLMSVPGVGVEPTWAEVPRDSQATGKGQ